MLYKNCIYLFTYFLSSTKKIVGISTVSRTDHGVAQTRELQCTKIAVPQAIARGVAPFCVSIVIQVGML